MFLLYGTHNIIDGILKLIRYLNTSADAFKEIILTHLCGLFRTTDISLFPVDFSQLSLL